MHRIRLRWLACSVAAALVLAACGGGKEIDDGQASSGSTAATTPTSGAADNCAGQTLEASDTGVTADTITITVMADTGSPLAPGLFQGPVDAVEGWVDWKNANGGVACRQVELVKWDSKLSADEAKNGAVNACDTSLAFVGTTSLFFNDPKPLEECEGTGGTGLPDFAVLQTEPVHQCSPVSYAVVPPSASCPYSGSGERTYKVNIDMWQWYLDNVDPDLHGVWVIPADLPSTISSSMPGFRMSQDLDGDGPGTEGIGFDAEFGASGVQPQSAYTPIVQAMKDNEATYARNGIDYVGNIKMRKEAQIQGVDTVKVWDCSLQCYTPKFLEEGGDAVEGQYVWMGFLPFEEGGQNEVLDAFLEAVPAEKRDGFAAQAWASAELFARAVEDAVAAKGDPNVTRIDVLNALKEIDDFDAGGFMATTDIAAKTGSPCYVLLQVQDGAYVRVNPTEPGTFDCESEIAEITLDPTTAFTG